MHLSCHAQESHGVCTDGYGKGKAKTVGELFEEVNIPFKPCMMTKTFMMNIIHYRYCRVPF